MDTGVFISAGMTQPGISQRFTDQCTGEMHVRFDRAMARPRRPGPRSSFSPRLTVRASLAPCTEWEGVIPDRIR